MDLQFIPITTENTYLLAAYGDIREKDRLRRDNHFIAEGKVVLAVLLRSRSFQVESLLISTRKLPNLMPLLQETRPQCPIYIAEPPLLDNIAGFPVHRGILAIGKRIAPKLIDDFFDNMAENALLVVLNSISNHDNVGSVFRNAAAFAADGVILDGQCCDPLYRKAIRVSVGAALKVPYVEGHTITELSKILQEHRFKILAFSGQGKTELADCVAVHKGKSNRLALLFGSEGEGLPKEILAATETVRIPIAADFDSLNIATACGIALSYFTDKTRLATKKL